MANMTDEAKRQQIEAMYQKSRRLFPEVPELTPQQLAARRAEEKVVLVDVRSPAEQAVSMIPGAITSEQFEQNPSEYEGATIVTYCTIGHRSGLYAQQLLSRGLKAVNLKGAILGWTHNGGELKDAGGPTHRLHVNNPKCALQAEGYEGVW